MLREEINITRYVCSSGGGTGSSSIGRGTVAAGVSGSPWLRARRAINAPKPLFSLPSTMPISNTNSPSTTVCVYSLCSLIYTYIHKRSVLNVCVGVCVGVCGCHTCIVSENLRIMYDICIYKYIVVCVLVSNMYRYSRL